MFVKERRDWIGVARQALVVFLMNIPTLSYGLTLGWMSFASGGAGLHERPNPPGSLLNGSGLPGSQAGAGSEDGAGSLLNAAACTWLAGAAAVPLAAALLTRGRKVAVIAASGAFVLCWSLKLVGLYTAGAGASWWVVGGRAAGGAGGAAAWLVAPLMATEMCSSCIRGAGVSCVVVSHTLGMMLMYLAADMELSHSTVLVSCLALSLLHCLVFLFMPESPAYLAANGKSEEALRSLCWLRAADEAAVQDELKQMASQQEYVAPWTLTKEMLSHAGRRRALAVSGLLVVVGEAGGVQAALQFAERLLRGGEGVGGEVEAREGSEARLTLWLGATQLLASLLALWLVEKVGRKRLIVSSAVVTSVCLCVCGVLTSQGALTSLRAGALAGAVAGDAGGLQPASYALLADYFNYRYRGCALTLVSIAACFFSAVELYAWGAAWSSGGAAAALWLAAAVTALYAAGAALLPNTDGLQPEEVYKLYCPSKGGNCNETVCTKC